MGSGEFSGQGVRSFMRWNHRKVVSPSDVVKVGARKPAGWINSTRETKLSPKETSHNKEKQTWELGYQLMDEGKCISVLCRWHQASKVFENSFSMSLQQEVGMPPTMQNASTAGMGTFSPALSGRTVKATGVHPNLLIWRGAGPKHRKHQWLFVKLQLSAAIIGAKKIFTWL